MSSKIPTRIGVGAWWMLAILWLLYALSFVHKYTIAMLVDPIKLDLGLSDFQMGLILGPAFSITYAVAMLPFGWAADRFPNRRRSVAAGGSIAVSIATIIMGAAQSFGVMLGARIGVGVSEAAVAPTAYSMIADGFPKARLTTAIAIFQTGIKAGQATAFGLTGLLLAVVPVMTFGGFQLAPWRTIMILFAIPGLVAGLLLYTSRSPHREPRVVTEGQPGTLKAFAAQNRKILVKFLVGFLLADLCSAALVSWTPTFVSRTYAWSPEHYGPLMGVLSIAAAVVLVFKGYAVDWLYARGMKDAHIRFYCWLLAASLPIGFTLFHVSSPYLFFGMYAFLQLVMISFASFATASISTLAPAYLRARLIAIFLLLVNIVGGGLGPIIIGALNDYVFRDPMKIGLSLTTLISIAMPGALIFLWWVLKDWRAAIERSERTDDTSVGRGSPSQ